MSNEGRRTISAPGTRHCALRAHHSSHITRYWSGAMATEDQIAHLLERLVGIPERIAGVVAGWDATTLRAPAADGWSAAQILAHIRASDDILAPRIYAILTRDNPPLPAYDERRWAEIADYANARFAPS